MSEGSKAVFLSYASQDAEAARSIATTLRSAGVEVWFDVEGGLEHGDEWDAKIRRQIKECVLFIALISANTQARHEGYFRIEWDLAAERARGIASGVAFILPVVIDDTREPDALVPDRFRAVQWTRLRNGEMTPDVKARLLKLWSHRIGALKGSGGSGERVFPGASTTDAGTKWVGPEDPASHAPRLTRSPVAKLGAFVAVVVIGGAAIVWWQQARHATPATGQRVVTSNPAVTGSSEADQLVARAYAIVEKRMNYTRADLAAADTLARKATDLAPESGSAWAARAYIHAAHVWRNWDRSEKRRQDTEAFANRALAFDSGQSKAMLALAELYLAQRAFAQAEPLARRALALRPDDSHLHRILARAIAGQGRMDESDVMRQEIVRRFPQDPLVHYDLGNRQVRAGEFADALRSFDSALALEPFTSGRLNKARVLAGWTGDLTAARAVLDQIPPEDRTEIRAVGVGMWLSMLERRLDRVEAAAALTTQTYLDDAAIQANGPKALFLGLALHTAGKETLAQRQWRTAESAARARLREQPDDLLAIAHLATALAWLGRTEEAGREIAPFEASVRELADDGGAGILIARFYASLGNTGKAVSYLRSRRNSLETTGHLLSLDPWWDKLRGQPEFEAFVAEAKARLAAEGKPAPTAAPAVDPKSVVVLPFTNLSGDKDQEFFSDGITEEILNALARERDLRVVPRTSAFSFKGKNLPLPEIARALNVAQVVDGTLRRAGNLVRISCTLTRVADGFTQALPPFEREIKEGSQIFALQEDVARAVLEKITRRATTAAPLAIPTKNAEAYEAFLRGRDLMNQTSPSWPKAVEAFRRAVDLDPQFATAWAKLAHLSAALYAYGFDGRGLAESERAVREALRLRPDLWEAHLAQAFFLRATSAPHPAIERALALAAKDRPEDPEVLQMRGEMLLARGDDEEGIRSLQRGAVVDAQNGALLNMLGNALAATGRYDEAETAYRRAFDVLGSSVPWTNRARIYFHGRGDAALAARTLDEAPEEVRNERYWTGRALLLYIMGDQSRALAAAVHMQPRSGFFRIREFFTAKMREAAGDAAGARRDYLEALPLAEEQRDEFPALPTPYAILALVYAGLDRKTEALEAARKAVTLGQSTVDSNSLSERRHAGRSGVGALSLVDLELSSDAALAQVQARFGQVEEALAIVTSNVAAGHWRRNNLLRNPDWAILRKDQRFRALAEKAPL